MPMKQGENLDNYVEMIEVFSNIIKEKAIPVRNYYNSKFWRRVARVVLLSNLIPVAITVMGVVESKFIIPIIFVWLFISLPAPLITYSQQN